MATPTPLVRLADIEGLTETELRTRYDEAVAAAQLGSTDLWAFADLYKHELDVREERRRHKKEFCIEKWILGLIGVEILIGLATLAFPVYEMWKQAQKPYLVLTDQAHRSLLGEPPPNFHPEGHGRVLLNLTNAGAAVASEIRIEVRGEEGIGEITCENSFPFDTEVIPEGESATVVHILRLPNPLAQGRSLQLAFHFAPATDTSKHGIVHFHVMTNQEPAWRYLGGLTLRLRL